MPNNRDDVEGASPQQQARHAVTNPYTAGMAEPQFLPPRHPINVMKRSVIMGACIWGLHKFDVYDTILHSPKVRHEWFKIGLAASIAIIAIKSYVEMYAGKLKKQEVSYKNFRQQTHALLFLILLSSVAFNVALWPAYQWKTLGIMTMIGFGILLQFALLVPTYVQNVVGVILMTYFLQEYS